MKNELIYGIIWGFLGFFLTGLVGITNPIIQVAIIVVGIIAMHFIFFKPKEKNE